MERRQEGGVVKQGQEVLIVDHPGRYKWMKDMVGKKAEIEEVHVLYRVKVGEEAFWIGEAYVEELDE